MKKRQPLLVSEGNLRTAARGRRPHRRCIDGPNRRQKSRFVPTRRGTTSLPTVRDRPRSLRRRRRLMATETGPARRVRTGRFEGVPTGCLPGATRERETLAILPRVRKRSSRARATHARTVVVGLRARRCALGDDGGATAPLALLARTRRPGGKRRRRRRHSSPSISTACSSPRKAGRRDPERSRGAGEPLRGGTSPGFGLIVPARNRTRAEAGDRARRARRKPPR